MDLMLRKQVMLGQFLGLFGLLLIGLAFLFQKGWLGYWGAIFACFGFVFYYLLRF